MLPEHASPSSLTESGVLNELRRQVERWEVVGNISIDTLARRYMDKECRVMEIKVFRGTAGDAAGSTDIDLHAKIGTADEARILADTVQIEQSGGDNQRVTGALDTANAAHDGTGIVLSPGDYLVPYVDAIETDSAPADLTIEVVLLIG